jgi:hypothetical protein
MWRRIVLLGVIAATLASSARAETVRYPTTGFGVDGIAKVDAVDAIASAPDGTIVVAGGGGGGVIIGRYSAGGRPIGFGPQEKTRSLATGTDCSPGLAVRRDGAVVVACGDIVATLRPNGSVQSLTSVAGAHFDSLAIDEVGRTVAAGRVLLRLNADGRIDGSFARDALPSAATSVAIDGGRILLVAGGSILGYDGDGTPDTLFGSGGVASFAGFTATSIGTYSHRIVAGGSRGDQAAVVRYSAGGAVDTSFGTSGIAAWGPDQDMMREVVVALGMRAGGSIDTAVLAVGKPDIYNSTENSERWLVQRVSTTGAVGGSGDGPTRYIDPTEECFQEFPVALAEQPNGKTLVSGIACRDAVDYTTYFLVARYDRTLEPDVGVALRVRITGEPELHGNTVAVRIAVNGPARLVVRLQTLDGRDPIGAWLSPTRLDVAHGPAFVRLRIAHGALRPRGRYAVVVSAYDARGSFTRMLAPIARRS